MAMATEQDIEAFAEDVRERLGDRVERVVLYGSYARGDQVPGSDIDIAVIVSDKEQGDRRAVMELAEAWIADTGLYFSPRVFDEADFEAKVDAGYSFHRSVAAEGVVV